MSRLLSLAVAATVLAALTAAPAPKTETAADWPQFRGPKLNDHSPDKGLLKEWPKDGPKLVWKGEGVGIGYSSVSVVGDKVFTMGDKDGSSHVFALSRDKGEIVWSVKSGKPEGGNWPGTPCTPTVDGDRVYALGQDGTLLCLDKGSGQIKWRKDLKSKELGGNVGGWKYSESPLIDGDRLVCTPGGKKATLLGLDKKTGEEVWRAPIGDRAEYSSLVISNAGGVKQYVQLTADGTIGVSAKDGKLLWRYDRFSRNTANAPSPIVLGDKIFTSTGYGRGGALLALTADGDGVKMEPVYHERVFGNMHGGQIVLGDYIYGDTDSSGNPYCAEWKTGKVKWTRRGTKGPRDQGGGSAALTYADGMLYIRYDNGWVSLVPADPAGFSFKGNFKVPNGERQCWAHPVVIGGRLYIREKDVVWCYDVKAQ